MSTGRQWLIYGAYGYTGELVVRQALAQGQQPVVAGRNADKIAVIAERYNLEARVFSVDQASEQLADIGTLINCAGPFDTTAEPLMDACLAAGVHYLDITGEIPVFQAAQARQQSALEQGVVLCPGTGFDVVPTDCLAALLKQALPEANRLELAFDFGALPSQGTTRTAVKNVGVGGMIMEQGELKPVPMGYQIRKVPFAHKPLWAVSFPWADVFTAQVSTGIPNTIVYAAMPQLICYLNRLSNPIRRFLSTAQVQKCLHSLVSVLVDDGPSDSIRANTHSNFWGRVTSADGRECIGTITAPSVYDLTAETTVAIAAVLAWSDKPGGFYTPSALVGADFLSKRSGFHIQLGPVSASSGEESGTKFTPSSRFKTDKSG